MHERYRQTDDRRQTTDRRQTDGRTTTYSEHEHEFTFAKNVKNVRKTWQVNCGLLVLRWRCRLGGGQSYCSCSKWPPLAAKGSQALVVNFDIALLMCPCGSSSQMDCRATFNSSVVLVLAAVYGTFPAWSPIRDSSADSNMESLQWDLFLLLLLLLLLLFFFFFFFFSMNAKQLS